MKKIVDLLMVPLILIARYRRSVIEIKKIKKCDHRLADINVSNTKVLASRASMLELLPKGGSVAEIGVAAGDFSKSILEINQPHVLHLVDYWKQNRFASGATPRNILKQMAGGSVDAWENINKRFSKEINSGTIKLHRGYSWEELEKFEDHYFDWVYIDASHDFDSVSKDLILAGQKLKPSGIIAGHDYVRWGRFGYKCGVVEAVNSFCKEHKYELIYLTLESNTNSSFAIKKINPRS